MTNSTEIRTDGRAAFLCRAAACHLALLASLSLYNFSLSNLPPASWEWILKSAYSILFLSSCLIFYFRPDMFFISHSMRLKILYRNDTSKPLSLPVFYLSKLLVWLVVLSVPVALFIFSQQIPGFAKIYLLLGYLFFLAINGSFLFSNYRIYLAKKADNKWGVLAVY